MLSLDNICPHSQVAKGFLQTCPQDTTKFIGFYKQQFWRIPIGFLVFIESYFQVNINLYLYPQGYNLSKGTYRELKCFIEPFTKFEISSTFLNSHQRILQKNPVSRISIGQKLLLIDRVLFLIDRMLFSIGRTGIEQRLRHLETP